MIEKQVIIFKYFCTWEYNKLFNNQTIINSKWIFKVNCNFNNFILRYKTRLVL